MAIDSLLDKRVTVSRLKDTSGAQRRFVTTATVDMAIQEMDKRSILELELTQDKAWKGFGSIEDTFKNGDLVVDEEGNRYKVQEAVEKDYGINQHWELVLVRYDKT